MAAKGQSMVGGREVAQIKRARPVVRRTVSRCPGRPSTGSSRALDASRLDRGAGGGDRDTTGCIPLHFVPCAPPLRRHWWPGGRRCGSVGERWEWVCCERGTKAEPLLLLLHGKTAAGLPLLPLPALPALPLAIDLVQAIIRVLGPCPERAFSAVDFVADAIVTLQYCRPQCSTPRGERVFWANYGPVLGQFWANSGVENNGSRGHHRESSTAFPMCRAPAPVHVDCRTDGAAIQTAGLVQQTWPARHATRDGIVRVQTETKCFRHPPSHPHHTRRRWPFC